jgi:hypothetical protein
MNAARSNAPSARPTTLGYLRRRHEPLTSLVLTIPVFLVYHLGILFIDRRNGVDLVSGLTLSLLDYSVIAYVAVTLGVAAALVAAFWWFRGRSHLRPKALLAVLAESTVLAVVMLFSVGWATEKVVPGATHFPLAADHVLSGSQQVARAPLGPFDKLVMAAGAGLHEELVFRVLLFAGGTWLLLRATRMRRLYALLLAALGSSVLFSAVHYIGPLADDWQLMSFTFRLFAGLFFAAVYRWRGFAVAVYTHTLYDLIVFFL